MKKQKNMRTVYLLLTRSETCFSRLIHLVTEDDYTHASIGLDGPTGSFYSFGRKNPRMLFPAGLVEEQVGSGFFSLHPHIPCCLYAMTVSESTYRALREKVEAMYAQREQYHYNLLGALACFFHLRLPRQHHYFCSEFVAKMLAESGAAELPQPPELTRPIDFCQLGYLRPVHQGEMGALASVVV